MNETIGSDRKIAIVREISKIYEEVFRGTIEEAILEYNERTIKGEFVICIDKA
jgi:16S rRNA (cytidine1402-2'-O)-methyltransferase